MVVLSWVLQKPLYNLPFTDEASYYSVILSHVPGVHQIFYFHFLIIPIIQKPIIPIL